MFAWGPSVGAATFPFAFIVKEVSLEVMPTDAAERSRQPDESTVVDGDSPDWGFARQPFWLFSHLIAVVVVVSFVNFGFWQLRRLDERQLVNVEVEAALNTPPMDVLSASEIDLLPEYQPVRVSGELLESDLARVVNRSHRSQAGEYVVGILRLDDGSLLALNRGFVTIGVEDLDPAPTRTEVFGWVRPSVEQERFGIDDTGTTKQMPRLNTDMVEVRLGSDLASNWLQVAPEVDGSSSALRPEPVPLPPLTEGSHLSYAVQWFVFALLTLLFYGALLRRRSGPGGA